MRSIERSPFGHSLERYPYSIHDCDSKTKLERTLIFLFCISKKLWPISISEPNKFRITLWSIVFVSQNQKRAKKKYIFHSIKSTHKKWRSLERYAEVTLTVDFKKKNLKRSRNCFARSLESKTKNVGFLSSSILLIFFCRRKSLFNLFAFQNFLGSNLADLSKL